MLLPWLLLAFTLAARPPADTPFMRGELIFPPMARHNHASCVVECPNGDLLACWYRGSGEKSADDVAIWGARLKKGSAHWSEAFVMADTPGFPDCNPCMIVDPQKRLWLFWPVILANQWESAIMRYQVSRDFQKDGPPHWQTSELMLLKPGPEFSAAVERDLETQWKTTIGKAAGTAAISARLNQQLDVWRAMAKDKLKSRLGWMPRAHPYLLNGKRLLVPLYSDGFDFSLVGITDDWGATWQCSAPMIGTGNVQPSLVQRKDGSLVAYFRNNGPPPHQVMVSESRDEGMTWSLAHYIDLPNPGSGLEAIVLKDGRWLLIGNDSTDHRSSLAIWVSSDEGRTWPIVRHLEHDEDARGAGSYSYPSIIQARDGLIHATYSYQGKQEGAKRSGETIKHVVLNEAWLLTGNAP